MQSVMNLKIKFRESFRPFAPCVLKERAHEWFERWARDTPEAVAVVAGEEAVGYKELDARANRLARRLTRGGVGRGSIVALAIKRSVEALVGILGILKTGAAYLPIDPELPAKRREQMMRISGASKVVTKGPPSGITGVEDVTIEGFGPRVESDSSVVSTPGSLADALVVLFTSGSTGQPKGVLLPHSGPLNYALGIAESWGVTADDRILQFASLGFDVSLEEILLAWVTGATLVLRDDAMLDPHVLLEACNRHRVTIFDLPTAYFVMLLDLVEEQTIRWPTSLRLVCIGGERAHAEWIERFHWRRNQQPRLINAYGPTETSVSVTCCETRDYLDGGKLRYASPLGRVVPNCRVFLLADDLSLVVPGVEGEICISGAALARG
jgi:aspartate racemase